MERRGVGSCHGSLKKVWEELADTRERLTVAGETRSHKCTRGGESEVRRKRHI